MKFTRPRGLSHTGVGTSRQTRTANIPNAMKHGPRLRPPRCGVQNCTCRKVLEYLPQSTISRRARRTPRLAVRRPMHYRMYNLRFIKKMPLSPPQKGMQTFTSLSPCRDLKFYINTCLAPSVNIPLNPIAAACAPISSL